LAAPSLCTTTTSTSPSPLQQTTTPSTKSPPPHFQPKRHPPFSNTRSSGESNRKSTDACTPAG
jgi:hypothetical protein